ncbi:MAG: hypothetical protein AAGH79_01565 [Bacteroidota bacterium]
MQFEWLQPPRVSLQELAALRALRPLPSDAEFPTWLETAPADFWPWLLQQKPTTSTKPRVNAGWSLWESAEQYQPKLFFHLSPEEVIEFPWSESATQIKGLVHFFREQKLVQGSTVLSNLPNIPERYWAFMAAAIGGLVWEELDSNLSPREWHQAISSPEVAIFLSQEQIGAQSIWEAAEQTRFPTTLYVPQQQWLIKERYHNKIFTWNQIISTPPEAMEWEKLGFNTVLYRGQPETHLGWMLRWTTEGLCQNIRTGDRLAVISDQSAVQLGGLKAWWWGADLHIGDIPMALNKLPVQHLEVGNIYRGAFPERLRSILIRGDQTMAKPPNPEVLALRVS